MHKNIHISSGPCILQRIEVIYDMPISVSKAIGQNERLKVRQDSLRLGNVGLFMYRWGAL